MPTTVTKSIGSAGGRDYSTIALWEAACPANLVTADQVWRGECYNDSLFSVATGVVTITGMTTDATRFIELACAAGQSFSDHASVRTNALAFNQANGVALSSTNTYTTCVTVDTAFCRLTGLQIQGANGLQSRAISPSNVTLTVHECILSAREVFNVGSTSGITAINCLLESRGAGTIIVNAFGSHRLEFCTMVRGTNGGSPGTIGYGTLTVENCGIFNFTAGFATSTGGALAGGFNCTDFTSAPGASNQVSKVYADQVVNTASDWRAKAGGSMVNGTPATSYTTIDISILTRHVTTPTIGCWELAASTIVARRVLINQAVQRASNV